MPRQKLGLPVEPKGFGQNEGMKMKKNLYTRQVENLKRRLGQKWVSRWTENPKGQSRQKLGIKHNTMSHWITLHPESGTYIKFRRHRSVSFTFNQGHQVMRRSEL